MSTRTSLRLSALKPIWFLVSHAFLISTSESNVANFQVFKSQSMIHLFKKVMLPLSREKRFKLDISKTKPLLYIVKPGQQKLLIVLTV